MEQLSELAEALIAILSQGGVEVESNPMTAECEVFRVAGASDLGDLLIWVYAEEIIVGLDRHRMVHSHFDEFFALPGASQPRTELIASLAAEHVLDVVAGRILFEFGERGNSSYRKGMRLEARPGSKYFTWLGPTTPGEFCR